MTVLKKPWPRRRSRVSVNQAASSSDTAICGTKPMIHISSVLPKYFGKSVPEQLGIILKPHEIGADLL